MANVVLATLVPASFSELPNKLLRTPFNDKNSASMRGLIGKILDEQQTAASLAHSRHVAKHPGKLLRVLVSSAAPAAATETMVYDVQVNGVSVLTGTPELTNASPGAGVYDVSNLIVAGTFIKVGDVVDIIRTLANGSTITENDVQVEWG